MYHVDTCHDYKHIINLQRHEPLVQHADLRDLHPDQPRVPGRPRPGRGGHQSRLQPSLQTGPGHSAPRQRGQRVRG